jgi:hypothetical protein
MGIKAEAEILQSTFTGMVSNVNPKDLRPGQAALQINVTAIRHGELSVRRGLRELTFDTDFT